MTEHFSVTVCVWPDLLWCYVGDLPDHADRSDDYVTLTLSVPDDLPLDTDLDDWVDSEIAADAAFGSGPGRFDDLVGYRFVDYCRRIWAYVRQW